MSCSGLGVLGLLLTEGERRALVHHLTRLEVGRMRVLVGLALRAPDEPGLSGFVWMPLAFSEMGAISMAISAAMLKASISGCGGGDDPALSPSLSSSPSNPHLRSWFQAEALSKLGRSTQEAREQHLSIDTSNAITIETGCVH